MEPRIAAAALASTLLSPKDPHTIADAAARSGLALRDAERGLHWLTKEYRGHLRVTESGELLFLFPHGFTKPWETRDALARARAGVARVSLGILRFVVRAWISIVMIGYAVFFVALMLGLVTSRSSDTKGGWGKVALVLLRVLGDSLFWTFRPLSYPADDIARNARRGTKRIEPARTPTAFYEKVNRFFFGPAAAREDPRRVERDLLSEVRALEGRIGLADVMRVTGLPREEADPMMARLMLDYEGEVDVSEGGGIFYRFAALRRTAEPSNPTPRPEPAWEKRRDLPAFTGNDVGSNALIVALNVFNALMAIVSIGKDLTLANIGRRIGGVPVGNIHYDGIPLVLGLVPLVFSLVLLLVPVARALGRPAHARKLARENGRLALLREITEGVQSKSAITESRLARAWEEATGRAPEPRELTRIAVSLGGDVDLDASDASGDVRYRFADLETEASALEEEREAAPEDEKKVGGVVFASDE